MKKLLPFLVSSALIALFHPSADAQFTSTGPNGGAVYSFYRDNGRIFAAGSGGIYISGDEGISWQESSGSPSVFNCDALYSVAAFGSDVYAGSRQTGIYRSFSNGATWQASSTGLRIGPGAPYSDIELIGPNVAAIRPDSGYLYVSNNQGVTWAQVNPLISNASARYLSTHNNTLYVSTPQGLFSSPSGLTYMMVNPSPADFGRLTWVNDTVYAATTTGVKMSLDGGMSFTTVALPGRTVRYVAVVGTNMYAVVRGLGPLQDSVLYSTNSGASFTAAPFSANFRFTTINDLMTTANGGVLVGTDYGMYASRNSGSTWILSDSGYKATTVHGLASSGAYVFAGTSPMGVFRAVPDSGSLVWQHTGSLDSNVEGNITAIAASGAYVHAGGSLNYYRSADSGRSWTAGTLGISSGNVTSIYASSASADVWLIRNGNLFYSANDGASFGQVVNSNIPLNQSLYVTKADTALFVVAASNLYKGSSSLMGFSLTSGITGRVTAVAYTADSTFYAATDGFGLYSSKNGLSWSTVSVAPGIPAKINTLIADSATLIAGTDDGYYTNAGGTWGIGGLQDHVILSLATRAGKLFAGTCSGAYSIPYKIVNPPPPATSVLSPGKNAWRMDIFPNPAAGNFTVRMQAVSAGTAGIILRNMLGEVVLKRSAILKVGSNDLGISAKDANLMPGVYLVQLTGAGGGATGRVVLR